MCPLVLRPAEATGKHDGVHVSSSLDSALELLAGPDFDCRVENVFVIGGGQVRPRDPLSVLSLCRRHAALVSVPRKMLC
jgi:hypothetical protein